MCGRIAQTQIIQNLTQSYAVQLGGDEISCVPPSYNIAPGSGVIVLLINHSGDKTWGILKWGMLPPWMKRKRSVINARAETVYQKPMFRNAMRHRRVLIPATAYYEWKPIDQTKQPYCIRQTDGAPLLLAGLYTENECVIITRPARQDIAFIHDRMPVIIDDHQAHLYLEKADSAHKMLMYNNDHLNLDIYPVTKRIGNSSFNESLCLESINSKHIDHK